MINIARIFLVSLLTSILPVNFATAKAADEAMGADLWGEALAAKAFHHEQVKNDDMMIVIDYSRHSSEPRFFLVDMNTMQTESFLVSHGRNSDLDHDGIADAFSNVSGSKMTSLGTYVTAETYYGKHGLSLRLDGLDKENSRARERAIVIHGADYVTPTRTKMGRSWGCPALERAVAERLIPEIANGVLIYVRGDAPNQQFASAGKSRGSR
ncbi:MAG TPA: murein L,D-transpeptidase catalytic domain family protein [Henriciella marina]|uniref:murein L,D-transpeptidase catalytic domain family protein n=1 Tax=Henriciella sp. TaxID=1968823 RepID=UPI0017AF2712|nr:murein L,D-transpeptidase catalytic domain family protein [Henriciella sp.]HIG23411.1 murein L,D-transpeptidase catalytic domain family protein [Henriciella sp.]HIK66298.1 murein L,D-transpeptidase catalytic domain family protein [Henriciella marina]